MTDVLVIDNYDSFVYNLVHYLARLGAQCRVVRNDVADVGELLAAPPAGVLISPGPGRPEDAGVCLPLVRAAGERGVPVLGVCLGHQAVAAAWGGRVVAASELRHGKTSEVHHDGRGVLRGLPAPFLATRYHSLAVDPDGLPPELEVTATTDDGTVMALRHRDLPVEGVQFHPESVLSQGGHRLLANWLADCGAPDATESAAGLDAAVATWRSS